ncbi:hypothetical protein ACFV4G_11940 [Kitasatospora sp. NPDC059747]|uniref:hypothetical protein n=1 Tax=Kitasatospora sp. NPDC059747 TaxID=3346930 RepID=UPI00365408C1
MVHPLMLLRTGMGLSHPEYARLVAERHAGLGFGRMAARREKVSRWESGRIVPEYTAQLAMAEIHDVPAVEVDRLGWPHWLYLAVGDALLHDGQHTPESAVAALRGSSHLAEAPCPPSLVLRGHALADQLTAVSARVADPVGGHSRDGPPPAVEQLDWLELRVASLEQQFNRSHVTPDALYVAALAEHRLAVRLLTTAGYDRRTGRRLLVLAASSGLQLGWICNTLGEYARGERQTLAAMRAAAVAGDAGLVSAAMMLLALRYLDADDPADARLLVRAARVVFPHYSPDFAIVLHEEDALALARQGEAGGAARSLDRAAQTLAAHSGTTDDAAHHLVLTLARARVALNLGDVREADRYIDTVTPYLTTPRDGARSPHASGWLLQVLETRIAAGELDRAA